MCINPIFTATNCYGCSWPVFRAGVTKTGPIRQKNVNKAVSGSAVRNAKQNISAETQKMASEQVKKGNFYYNKDIVQEIGPDGKTYLLLDDRKNERTERADYFNEKYPLNVYFEQVGNNPVLSVEEEENLTQNYCNTRSAETMEILIKSNLPFVIDVANKYKGMGLSFYDLIGEGNIGLIKAAMTYDDTRGFRFCSYAVKCIESHIISALRQNARTIRIPASMINRVNEIKKVMAELSEELGRNPTLPEIADKLNLPERKIVTALNTTKMIVSADAPVSSENNSIRLIDNITSESDDYINETNDIYDKRLAVFKKEFNKLNSMEQDVLSLIYGLNNKAAMTVEEIAFMYKVSGEEILNVKKRALRYLKKHCRKSISQMIK